MALLNYTTTVAATKSVAEIQVILAKAGAEQVIIRYGKDTNPSAIVFGLGDDMYVLPCRVDAVQEKLKRQGVTAKYRTREHALKVAWRNIKDWVEAQLALISTDMVEAQEVMLPYMLMEGDKTVYGSFVEQRAERLLEQKGKK